MNIYDRATEWAEAAAKDIDETARTFAKAVGDPEKVKTAIETALLTVPHLIEDKVPGISEMIRSIEATAPEAIKRAIDIVADTLKVVVDTVMDRAPSEKGAAEQADRADGPKPAPGEPAKTDPEAKAGPEVGANEQKNEQKTAEAPKVSEQETDALKAQFVSEQKALVGKLDAMRDKYFENHPNLPGDQRDDAAATFKTIKDDAVQALTTQQDTRLLEHETRQQESRDNSEQKRKELDEIRDARA
jgi:hypothetical protein